MRRSSRRRKREHKKFTKEVGDRHDEARTCVRYRLGARNCTRTRVGRSASRARDGKSHYLDVLLLVLTLPFVRSREVEFRLDVVHICKRRSKGVEV